MLQQLTTEKEQREQQHSVNYVVTIKLTADKRGYAAWNLRSFAFICGFSVFINESKIKYGA